MKLPVGEQRFAIMTVTALLACSLCGCDGPNLTEYRPASEHDAADRLATSDSPKVETQTPRSQPATTSEEVTGPVEADLELLPVSALIPVNVVSSVRELISVPGGDANPGIGLAGSGQPNSAAPHTLSSKTDDATSASKSTQIEILIKDKKFQTEPKTGALRVSFDDLDLLKVLNMDPVTANAHELMPEWLKGLDGKPIRIRGFMYPTYETEGIERFVLARDNQICCFGRDPKIYDLVQIDMKAGKTTNYIPATRAFDVVGTFRIAMQSDEGKPYGLYVIEQAAVIDR